VPRDHPESRRLLVGDLVVDAGRHEVYRQSEKIDLPRLSYRLLLALVEASPRVVSQDELIERVWAGRITTPETITQRIKLLRKALGDDASSPRYIGLVRGEGYRLLVDVEELPPEDAGPAGGLVTELKRRRVPQVALVYAAAAWGVTEVVAFLLDALPVFPEWSKPLVAILFIVGFPVTMLLAWRFDIGPGGIRRTEAATREGRLVIALALVLMVGATGGLFYLIYPSVVSPELDRLELRAGGAEAPENTIAVLQLELASEDQGDLYISDGFGDALRERLGRLGGLQVAARSSSAVFAERPAEATEIADRLGVNKLIEGTVQRNGNALNVSIYIIDGETGFQVWSDTWERTMADLSAVQQDIAEQVVAQLLPGRDASLGFGDPASLDANATELLWLADRNYREVRDQSIVDVSKLMRAIELYRRATIADPESAIAYSRLAAAFLYLGDVDSAEEPISRAKAIDPDISEVQLTQGLYYWLRYKPGSGEAFRRAVELNPNNADALEAYAKWIWHQLDADTPEDLYLRALELDPMSIARFADLATFYGMSGRRDEARAVVQSILDRFDGPNAYQIIARILELTGDLDEAIGWALRARKLDPDNEAPSWQLAELYARIGDFEAAAEYEPEPTFGLLYWERRYEEMIDLGDELVLEHPNQVQLWYGLGRAYNAMGRFDETIWVLTSHDIPERALSENRRANDEEALLSLADAYKETGKVEEATRLAAWMKPKMQRVIETGSNDFWWGHLYLACAHSILDEDDAALDELERVAESIGMPWYPILMDAPCLRKFADEPRYRAVVDVIEDRKRQLRQRLPATLRAFANDETRPANDD
jgi:TolB-like protein/DNA-binding winged helix-turn-helix (wHTH) protein/Tfp pilus assembly protein PilF